MTNGGGGGGAGSEAAFVSFREERRPSSRGPKGGYVIHFYVVDNHGQELLAAIGEDQGDAHYLYRSTDEVAAAGYTTLSGCHNRKDLQTWLQDLIRGSQERAGFKIEDAHDKDRLDEIQSKTCPGHFPGFVAYRMERCHTDEGVRASKWWLLDERGGEHLAVIGEERETRDGHYLYRTEEPFTSTHPLSCGSQAKVLRWVDEMIELHRPVAAGGGGGGPTAPDGAAAAAAASAGGGGGSDADLVSNSGTRGWCRPSAFKRTPGAGLRASGGAAAATPGTGPGGRRGSKRQRGSSDLASVHLGMPPEARQQLDLLAGWAVAEGAKRRAAAAAALAWLRDPPTEEQLQAVEHYCDKADKLLLMPLFPRPAAAAAPPSTAAAEPEAAAAAEPAAAAAAHEDSAAASQVLDASGCGGGGDNSGVGGGDRVGGSGATDALSPMRGPDGGAPPRREGLLVLELLEVVQELGAAYLPAALLRAPSDALRVMQRLRAHEDPVVAQAAAHVCQIWQHTAAHHIAVLTDPVYMKSPADDLTQLMATETVLSPGPKPAPPKSGGGPGGGGGGGRESVPAAGLAFGGLASRLEQADGSHDVTAAEGGTDAGADTGGGATTGAGAATAKVDSAATGGQRPSAAATSGGGRAAGGLLTETASSAHPNAGGAAAALPPAAPPQPSAAAAAVSGVAVTAERSIATEDRDRERDHCRHAPRPGSQLSARSPACTPAHSPFRSPVRSPRSGRASPRTQPWQLPGGLQQ